MKKIAIIPLVLLLLSPMVYAETFQVGGSTGWLLCEYNVGDSETFPQAHTSLTAYYNQQTGEGLYLYCIWDLSKNGNHIDGNYFSISTGYCPSPSESYTFNQAGDYNFTADIVGVNLTSGVPGTPYIVDEVSGTYDVCYPIPDPMTIWNIIKAFLCMLFPWLWFCA